MRINELSARSGLSIATIKYYKREGLLPPARATHPNQVAYGREHLERLRLIRVLTEIVGLSLVGVRTLLDAIDDPTMPAVDVLAVAHDAIPGGRYRTRRRHDDWQRARRRISTFLTARGWLVRPDAAALDEAADALSALRSLGHDLRVDALSERARLAQEVAAAEERMVPLQSRNGTIRGVIGLAASEAFFVALSRLAREDRWARFRLGPASDDTALRLTAARPTTVTCPHPATDRKSSIRTFGDDR